MGILRRKIYNFLHPQLGIILMLHRVTEDLSTLKINRDIEVSPNFLEKTIMDYQNRGYCFASFDDVYQILAGERRIDKPFVCFTLDDGYKDNYEVAYPIFKKYNCPFTIYVTTDFLNRKAVIWWYILEDILMQHDKLILGDKTEYDINSLDKKNAAFEKIHQKLSALEPMDLKNTFDTLFCNYSYSFFSKVDELALSEDELISLASDNICTIGSHTVTHPHLEFMGADKQEKEIGNSKRILQDLLNKQIEHFSYPFGSHNAESIKLSEKLGYKTATIAWGGNTRKGDNLYKLKRVNLTEN